MPSLSDLPSECPPVRRVLPECASVWQGSGKDGGDVARAARSIQACCMTKCAPTRTPRVAIAYLRAGGGRVVVRPLSTSRLCACYFESMAAAEVPINVVLPSAALAQEPAAVIERRLRLLWALDEIRAGRATRVGAAGWLGLPLDEFLALADAHGLPAFDYDPDDFKSELASLT
jgi:hypothetical protein